MVGPAVPVSTPQVSTALDGTLTVLYKPKQEDNEETNPNAEDSLQPSKEGILKEI